MMQEPLVYKTKTLDPTFKKNFLREIEYHVKRRKMPSYLEIIIELCEKHEIEPESVAMLLSQPIKDRLESEAMGLHLISKPAHTFIGFDV